MFHIGAMQMCAVCVLSTFYDCYNFSYCVLCFNKTDPILHSFQSSNAHLELHAIINKLADKQKAQYEWDMSQTERYVLNVYYARCAQYLAKMELKE